jgi:signal transduction histidine kinase
MSRVFIYGTLYFVAALGLTLATATTFFGIPHVDLPGFALLLAPVGGCGAVVASLLMRQMQRNRFGGVRGQLVSVSLLGCWLLVGMLLLGAREMFISSHDLSVLLTMLMFSGLLSIGLSMLWSAPLTIRIQRVRAGTAQLAAGQLDTTLPVDGHDEIAQLAVDFNRMAAALQHAAEHERELEQARRDLIAAVSHDLRTPLSAVRALIEAVADGIATDPETEERYLRSAQNEIAHLSQLVDDLFELAQIDAGVLRLNLERASLHDLISDTLSSMQVQAQQQGVRLVGEVTGDIDPVLMSPPKLQRVLHNLISNALRHTPADGTILLRAQPCGDVVQVEVADTGEGIASEDLPHIFERTYRGEKSRTRYGHERSAGAGLGLTIARGLIEAHGGTMSVESTVGQGARFCFTLQRA